MTCFQKALRLFLVLKASIFLAASVDDPVGLIQCAIIIKLSANSAPVLSMYQYTFKYAYADAGSKNKPSRNIPLKCELCYPTLPPEPGRTCRFKVPLAAVDTYGDTTCPNTS